MVNSVKCKSSWNIFSLLESGTLWNSSILHSYNSTFVPLVTSIDIDPQWGKESFFGWRENYWLPAYFLLSFYFCCCFSSRDLMGWSCGNAEWHTSLGRALDDSSLLLRLLLAATSFPFLSDLPSSIAHQITHHTKKYQPHPPTNKYKDEIYLVRFIVLCRHLLVFFSSPNTNRQSLRIPFDRWQ